MGTGIGCRCTTCRSDQWYDAGVCQGCHSEAAIECTWVVRGGTLLPAPTEQFKLKSGASDRLVDIWRDLVLVRSLTPVSRGGVHRSTTPGWYVQRGMRWSTQFHNPVTGLDREINRAADWTNSSFVLRMVATFEAFADGNDVAEARLPNLTGMREFHHARRLRNCIAHGKPLTKQRDVNEETALFRQGDEVAPACSLAIDVVLEPLWARVLLYAMAIERGALAQNRAVVAAVNQQILTVQTTSERRELSLSDGDSRLNARIGDVVSV